MALETGVAAPVAQSDYLPIGRGKKARRAYGFDEVALVPGRVTVNPEEIDISTVIGGHRLDGGLPRQARQRGLQLGQAVGMGADLADAFSAARDPRSHCRRQPPLPLCATGMPRHLVS